MSVLTTVRYTSSCLKGDHHSHFFSGRTGGRVTEFRVTHCIFCRRKTKIEPVEHVALEGLFGHQRFAVQDGTDQPGREVYLVLNNGQVCGFCNRVLNRDLDQNLQKQLGMLKVLWNGKGTKHGKPAKVERPGLYAIRRADRPYLLLNGGTKKITTEHGVTIHPPNNHPDAIRMKRFERHSNLVNISFDQPMRMNKRFVRGLYKIAFELLCFEKGPEFVLAPRFDSIRDYVRYGKGNRCIAFDNVPVDLREKPTLELCQIPGTQDCFAVIAVFFVDLTPDNSFLKNADEEKLKEEHLVKRWDVQVR